MNFLMLHLQRFLTNRSKLVCQIFTILTIRLLQFDPKGPMIVCIEIK